MRYVYLFSITKIFTMYFEKKTYSGLLIGFGLDTIAHANKFLI